MPLHHGGYPETHPVESEATHDRGDGKRRVLSEMDNDGPYFNGLRFDELQHANRERGKAWRAVGPALPAEYSAMELGGEAGELIEALAEFAAMNYRGVLVAIAAGKTQNAAKKFIRHQRGMAGGNPDLGAVEDEVADTVICCALLANKLGIDLGAAVARKFNKTSEKHGFPQRLRAA